MPPKHCCRVSTHSRPKAAGKSTAPLWLQCLFQLTAARRRLVWIVGLAFAFSNSFNSQPPEGGWMGKAKLLGLVVEVSTHSRPKAAGI